MATCVFRDSFRNIVQTKPPVSNSAAEIHIFEPQWEEAFIQSSELLPHRATHHKESPCRLLHRRTCGTVPVHTSIAPVHRISRPAPVQQESFQNQGRRCRHTAH